MIVDAALRDRIRTALLCNTNRASLENVSSNASRWMGGLETRVSRSGAASTLDRASLENVSINASRWMGGLETRIPRSGAASTLDRASLETRGAGNGRNAECVQLNTTFDLL